MTTTTAPMPSKRIPPGWAPCRRYGHLLGVRRAPKLVCSQCKHEQARRRGQRATS